MYLCIEMMCKKSFFVSDKVILIAFCFVLCTVCIGTLLTDLLSSAQQIQIIFNKPVLKIIGDAVFTKILKAPLENDDELSC